jgi:hypothetical protein
MRYWSETPIVEEAMAETRREPVTSRLKALVLQRDKTCQLCFRSGIPLDVDHIVPVAMGGATTLDNLAALCQSCNRGKGALYLGDYRNQGPRPPRAVQKFTVDGGSTSSGEQAFAPSWMIRQTYGDDPGYIEVRYRSRYGLTPWQYRQTAMLASGPFSTTINVTAGPTRDDELFGEYELGMEIRIPMGIGWMHELHTWRLTRTDHGYTVNLDFREILPPRFGFTRFQED